MRAERANVDRIVCQAFRKVIGFDPIGGLAYGAPRRRRYYTATQRSQALRLHKRGVPARHISSETGVHIWTVWKWIRDTKRGES